MEVHVDPVLLLAQPRLGLLHVLGDRVVADVLLALGLVEDFRRGEERLLERLAVDLEVLSVRVGLVETKGDCIGGTA